MNIFLTIVQALSIALQFAAQLPPLIQQFQQLFPSRPLAETQQLAARTLARTVMTSSPQLVNGTNEEMLFHALMATASHLVDEIAADQQKAKTAASGTA